MKRFAILLLLILGSCLPGSGKPAKQSMVHHLYVPLAYSAPAKKGVGLSYGICSDARAMRAYWQYSWSARPVDCEGIEDVPMIWGEQRMGENVQGDSSYLMGFNEPDRPGQANLVPAYAAELWHMLEAEHPDRLLVSPAPSHLHPEWLAEFRQAYIGRYGAPPKLDALAIHCYGTLTGCQPVIQQVVNYAQAWNIEGGVWVTEFAVLPCWYSNPADAVLEEERLIAWMEEQPTITRYAHFAARIQGDEWWGPDPACDTALFDWGTNTPTMYGEMYRETGP